jgi:hypothetical protein
MLLLGLGLLACGQGRQTEYGPTALVSTYLETVRPLLQEVRALDVRIARAVPADSVDAQLIAPLIEEDFRPRLVSLHERAGRIAHTAELEATHRLLEEYLRLRLEAFDLILQGVRQSRPELFAQFDLRLARADSLGSALESALFQIQQSLGR